MCCTTGNLIQNNLIIIRTIYFITLWPGYVVNLMLRALEGQGWSIVESDTNITNRNMIHKRYECSHFLTTKLYDMKNKESTLCTARCAGTPILTPKTHFYDKFGYRYVKSMFIWKILSCSILTLPISSLASIVKMSSFCEIRKYYDLFWEDSHISQISL